MTGEPLVGNILQQVRRNRKPKQAWTDSTSSISSSEMLDQKSVDFSNKIPQAPVDLELGLVGTEQHIDVSNENILETARTWRHQSAQNRERIKTADKARALNQLYLDE